SVSHLCVDDLVIVNGPDHHLKARATAVLHDDEISLGNRHGYDVVPAVNNAHVRPHDRRYGVNNDGVTGNGINVNGIGATPGIEVVNELVKRSAGHPVEKGYVNVGDRKSVV